MPPIYFVTAPRIFHEPISNLLLLGNNLEVTLEQSEPFSKNKATQWKVYKCYALVKNPAQNNHLFSQFFMIVSFWKQFMGSRLKNIGGVWMNKIPHTTVYPRRTLNLLSQDEIKGLTSTSNKIAKLFRDCALALALIAMVLIGGMSSVDFRK